MELKSGYIWWTSSEDEAKGKLIAINKKPNKESWYGILETNEGTMKFNITSSSQEQFYRQYIGEYLVIGPYENLRGVAVREHTNTPPSIGNGVNSTVQQNLTELIEDWDSTDMAVTDYLCERIHTLEIELEVLKQLKACWNKS